MPINFNTASRAAALGPVAELGEFFPEIPFAFDELVSGLPRGAARTGKGKTPTTAEKPQGLRAVAAFGDTIEIGDDDLLKQMRSNLEQEKQTAANALITNPRDPRNAKIISDYRAKVQAAELQAEKIRRNKGQIEKFRKAQEGGKHNPHDLLEAEKAIRNYALARNADPENVPDLNIEDMIAQLPEKLNRDTVINTNLNLVKKAGVFSKSDLLGARNASVQSLDGQRVLVKVTGQGVSRGRIVEALEETFNAPGFMEDITRQAESELETIGSSASTEEVNARVQEILDGHLNRAVNTFVGDTLSQTVSKIDDGGGRGRFKNASIGSVEKGEQVIPVWKRGSNLTNFLDLEKRPYKRAKIFSNTTKKMFAVDRNFPDAPPIKVSLVEFREIDGTMYVLARTREMMVTGDMKERYKDVKDENGAPILEDIQEGSRVTLSSDADVLIKYDQNREAVDAWLENNTGESPLPPGFGPEATFSPEESEDIPPTETPASKWDKFKR